jgi:hypothetical protein
MRSVLSSMCFGMALVCLVLGGCSNPSIPAGCDNLTGCGRVPIADPNNPGHQMVPLGPGGTNGFCTVRGSPDGPTCAYATTPSSAYPVADDCTGYGQNASSDPNSNGPGQIVDNNCDCSPIRAGGGTTAGCSCSGAKPPQGTHHANPT